MIPMMRRQDLQPQVKACFIISVIDGISEFGRAFLSLSGIESEWFAEKDSFGGVEKLHAFGHGGIHVYSILRID
jgi:hypothetical protein